MYPNSATRKLYGVAGSRLAGQRKQYGAILEAESKKARMTHMNLETQMAARIAAAETKYKQHRKIAVITVASLLLIIVLILFLWAASSNSD